MYFGLSLEKIALFAVVAALLIGPERLPRYAEALARVVTRARDWLKGAKSRVQEEMGDDFEEVDWRRLDPRQYDPRRIIREALLEDAPVSAPTPPSVTREAAAAAATVRPAAVRGFDAPTDERPPFDSEAT